MSNLIIDRKTFHLSTRSSACTVLNGDYKSNIQYDIPSMLIKDDSIEYIYFSIPYAVIPNSFYTVNETNNALIYSTNLTSGTVYFELGNYNTMYFITQFKKLMVGFGFSITFDTINSKFTISNTNPFTLFSNSSINYIMGFSGDVVGVYSENGTYTVTLPRPCNFLPVPRVCLRCPQLSGNDTVVSSSNSSDVVLSIPNSSKPNGEIVYQNSDIKHILKTDKLDRLNILFTNDDGDLLNFNGISCFFIIVFDIYRTYLPKPPTFHEITTLANSYNIDELDDTPE